MGLRRACLVLVLLLSGAPAAHGSTGRDPLLTARLLRLADGPALPEAVREAWRAALLYQYEDSIVAPLGDYDRDGVTDVVQWRIRFDGNLGDENVIDARSGRDGSLLWSYDPPDVPGAISGSHLLYPAKVGPQGHDGLIMLEINVNHDVATGAVYGIDGSGAQVWYYQAPQVFPLAVLDALPGAASDVLMGAYADSARPLLVNGSNGDVVQAAGASADAYDITALPDVSGDGLDDYVVLDRGGTARAYSAASADPLWSRPWAPQQATTVTGLGDMTGDGKQEAGFSWYATTAQGALVTGPTTVVDGATGHTLWTRPGHLQPLGDIDGDGHADTFAATKASGSTTVAAYDAKGRRRWQVRPPSPGHGDTSPVTYAIADVGGDGVRDVRWKVYLWGKTTDTAVGGWIDGRTGRVHSMPTGIAGAPVDAVDGAGADFARATAAAGVLTVDAWNGKSGALLWRTAVALPNTASVPYLPYAVTLGHDRCSDVAVTTYGDNVYFVVLFDGATGRPTLALRATHREQAEVATPAVRARTDRNRCG